MPTLQSSQAPPAGASNPKWLESLREAFFRSVPAFGELRTYSKKTAVSDTMAGLTVAAVADSAGHGLRANRRAAARTMGFTRPS